MTEQAGWQGGPGGERVRTPEIPIKLTGEVARSVMAAGHRSYLDLYRQAEGQSLALLRTDLMQREHADLVPQARALARRIGRREPEERVAAKGKYLEAGIDEWISDTLANEDEYPQGARALRLLGAKAGEPITAEYLYDNYLYPDGESEGEIVAKIIEKRKELIEALVEGSRGGDRRVDMVQLREMLKDIYPILRSNGILWATMAEGILQQPAGEKERWIANVLATGQSGQTEMNNKHRDMFVEFERASRTRLESYGASSRGGRPNGPDEDAFYSASMGFHPGEIGGTENIRVDVPQREQRLADVLEIPVAQIRETHAQIQRLMQEGRLGGIDVVADGMGHHGDGEFASSIATFTFVRDIARQLREGELTEEGIQDAALEADRAVARYNGNTRNGGTTFVAQVTDKNGETIVVSIGDARAYKKDNNGNVVRLTSDDSRVESEVQAGNIAPSDVLAHIDKNLITNALQRGNNRRETVHTARIRLDPKEQLLLVCDGVWEGVTHQTLLDLDTDINPQTNYAFEVAKYNQKVRDGGFPDTDYGDSLKRQEFSEIRQRVLRRVCGNINKEYYDAVSSGTSQEDAMNIAQGKIFQRLILRAREHMRMRELAQDLVTLAVGQASGDNVTAVVVECPFEGADVVAAPAQGAVKERRGIEDRSDLRGGAWPTIGVAKALLGAINPEFYNPATIVTEANVRGLRKQLNELNEVDVAPGARAKVLADPHFQGADVDQGLLREEIYIEADRRRRYIQDLIRDYRTLRGGEIDIPGLHEEIFRRDSDIPEEDRDLLYLAWAQSLLLVPKAQREGWLDRVMEVGMQPLSNDRELFQRLYDNREKQKAKAGTTRRRLLWGTGIGAAVASASWLGIDLSSGSGSPGGSPVPYGSETEVPPTERFTNPFAGKEANEISQELGINAGSFFYLRPDKPNDAIFQKIAKSAGVNGFLTTEGLLPIFPPAVMEQEGALKQASLAEGVPINVLGTIASIESAGELSANSGVAAGLMQIDIGFNLDKFLKTAKAMGITIPDADAYLAKWDSLSGQAKTDYGNSLSDPDPKKGDPYVKNALANASLSARVGAQILRDDYASVQARNAYGSYDPNNPVTWSLTLGCYNGGLGIAAENYYKQPTQSELYQVHALRFFMTAEIAAQLRNRQMNDTEIEKQLISEEVDARAYAYSENDTGIKLITDYLKVWIPLSQNPINASGDSQLTASLKAAYDTYLSGGYRYKYPISPGLRIWIENGGFDQWDSIPSNTNHSNYPKGTYLS